MGGFSLVREQLEDKKVLIGCIGVSIITYNAFRCLHQYFRNKQSDLVPIGTIKELYIYPAKSCKGKKVFSFYCGPKGPVYRELKDRYFQVINGSDGKFWTARQKPQMVLIDVNVENDVLTVQIPDKQAVHVNLEDVRKRKDVRQTTLHDRLRTDGLDCGDQLSAALSEFLEEPNTRMVVYTDDLFTERHCITEDTWWKNNTVPKRRDEVAYADLAPYMIQTEASLKDLNSRLDEEVTQLNFRPCIVIDQCAAWDEDKWLDLQIGNAQLQCFKPCTRCILTTVNPETGKKNPQMQPLKELRQFRLAPEGSMRNEFKDSPIFGVNAAVDKSDYIHVGQVVYARYKKSGVF